MQFFFLNGDHNKCNNSVMMIMVFNDTLVCVLLLLLPSHSVFDIIIIIMPIN